MYERTDLRQQSLDLLRFPLAVFVVIEHVFSTDALLIRGNLVETCGYPLFVAANRFIDAFIRSQSVPIFFFISGFVFFIGVNLFTRQRYVQKMKNRVKTLLIPYLIWNGVAFLLIALKMLPIFSRFSLYAQTESFSLSPMQVMDGRLYLPDPRSGDLIYIGNPLAPMNGSLWFLSDLMIVAVCTPLIYWAVRRFGWYTVAALGVIWFALGYTELDLTYLLSIAFFFFSFGAYMSINRKDMMLEFGKYFSWSVVLYPLLAVAHFVCAYCQPEWCLTIKQVNTIVGLVFAYNLSAYLLQKKYVKVFPFLVTASFFLYVTNSLLTVDRVVKPLYMLFPASSGIGFVLLYTLAAVLIVLSLLLVFYLMRRYCPALLKVVTGRK